jgi:hypothetical protein
MPSRTHWVYIDGRIRHFDLAARRQLRAMVQYYLDAGYFTAPVTDTLTGVLRTLPRSHRKAIPILRDILLSRLAIDLTGRLIPFRVRKGLRRSRNPIYIARRLA